MRAPLRALEPQGAGAGGGRGADEDHNQERCAQEQRDGGGHEGNGARIQGEDRPETKVFTATSEAKRPTVMPAAVRCTRGCSSQA